MVALELGGIEVDTCLGCGGIWLDAGDLEMMLGNQMPKRLLNIDAGTKRSKRKCPVCNKRMDTTAAGFTRITEIDTCPFGHGLWFDRGELQTVIESLDEPLKSVVVRELQAIFSLEH